MVKSKKYFLIINPCHQQAHIHDRNYVYNSLPLAWNISSFFSRWFAFFFFSYQRIFSILTYLFRVSSMSSYMKLFPQQWQECHNAQRSKHLVRKRWWCFFENPNNIYRLLALNVRTWSFLYVHMPFWVRNIFSVSLLALFLSFLKMSLFSTNIGFRYISIGKFTQNLVKCTHVQILNICACIAFGWWI